MTGGPRPRLVVTADDLGLRADWDEAIVDACARGVATSVSLVATGSTYDRAARRVRERGLDAGVHLDALSGAPVSPAGDVASLVDGRGRFRRSAVAFAARLALGRVRVEELEVEWDRQIARVRGDGIAPTHLNAHFHLHALPAVFDVVLALARRHGVPWVRLPRAPALPARSAADLAKTVVLASLARRAGRRARADVRLARCHGIGASGSLDLRAWRRILGGIGAGPGEVPCHPGQGDVETRTLASPELRRMLDDRVVLTTFRELSA